MRDASAGRELPPSRPDGAQELELLNERLVLRYLHEDGDAMPVLCKEDPPSPTLNISNSRRDVGSQL